MKKTLRIYFRTNLIERTFGDACGTIRLLIQRESRRDCTPDPNMHFRQENNLSQAEVHLHSNDTKSHADQAAGEGPSFSEGPDPSIVRRKQARGKGASPMEAPDPVEVICEKYSPWMPHNRLDPVQLQQQYQPRGRRGPRPP